MLSDQWGVPFRNPRFSLRFELGGEVFGNDRPVPRFVQAFDRARQVTRDAFEASQGVYAIVASSADPSLDLFAPVGDGFVALAASGFTKVHLSDWRAPWRPEEEDDDQALALWRAFDVTADEVSQDNLLWHAIAYEMAITPVSPIVPYLVDFERGILLHVYDDRGMDLISLNANNLLPIYEKWDAWLLDFDRPRMAQELAEHR